MARWSYLRFAGPYLASVGSRLSIGFDRPSRLHEAGAVRAISCAPAHRPGHPSSARGSTRGPRFQHLFVQHMQHMQHECVLTAAPGSTRGPSVRNCWAREPSACIKRGKPRSVSRGEPSREGRGAPSSNGTPGETHYERAQARSSDGALGVTTVPGVRAIAGQKEGGAAPAAARLPKPEGGDPGPIPHGAGPRG